MAQKTSTSASNCSLPEPNSSSSMGEGTAGLVPVSDSNSVECKKITISEAKILLVGAGGIGCEILKNLAISGFKHIDVIDLDTIDVSNLNRQFLFRKEHVGKSKAIIAKEAIMEFNPDLEVNAYHDSIFSRDFGVNYFKRFDLVLNALDNRTARNHVNRMCLTANIPLIESGTAGYLGQVEIIKKGLTMCYECSPKAAQKTYPGCTIRNTPSEPVHCIVWAKHLFNQLFGEDDPDQDVSPDTEDPELKQEENNHGSGDNFTTTETGNIQRVSTRKWAEEHDYEAEKLFNKFFCDDIKYLLSMENLWKTRKPPTPLKYKEAAEDSDENESGTNTDVWSLGKCSKIFSDTIARLKNDMKQRINLFWDKDDVDAMDFVTVCANFRSYIFGIERKSSFETKSIAGNIIPAIATANAIIAGLVTLYSIRILDGDCAQCYTIYLRQKSTASKAILMPESQLVQPNPKCYVCSTKPTVNLYVNVNQMTVEEFERDVLKDALNMLEPDVMLDGCGIIVISSEAGETDANKPKKLAQVGIVDGCVLKADDFVQQCEFTITVNDYVAQGRDEPPFKFVTEDGTSAKNTTEKDEIRSNTIEIIEGENTNVDDDDPQEGPSTKRRKMDSDDEDLIMID